MSPGRSELPLLPQELCESLQAFNQGLVVVARSDALNNALTATEFAQPKSVDNLPNRHGVRMVYPIGEYEDRNPVHGFILHHLIQEVAGGGQAFAITAVHDVDESVRVGQVMMPNLADSLMPAKVPHVKLHAFSSKIFDVEADCRNGNDGRIHQQAIKMVVLPAPSRPSMTMRNCNVSRSFSALLNFATYCPITSEAKNEQTGSLQHAITTLNAPLLLLLLMQRSMIKGKRVMTCGFAKNNYLRLCFHIGRTSHSRENLEKAEIT